MYPEAIQTLLFRGIIIVWSIGTVFLGNVWEKRPLPIIISIFKKVPAGKLYILHNLSGGAEERIFIYKNGIQQWW